MKTDPKIKAEKSRIFIVDDHPILREGLALLIGQEEDMIFVGEAGDVRKAVQGIEKTRPDLVIVDISLQGTSGLDLTRTVLAQYPEMKVLIMSMYDESVYMERVLKAGAKGYLSKQQASEHVIIAIRKVLMGDVYLSEKYRDRLMQKFIGCRNTPNESLSVSLSDRELEVLQLTGQGYSTRQIGEDLHVSVKTVESHYANIKNKLDLRNSRELIQYAVKWCLAEA